MRFMMIVFPAAPDGMPGAEAVAKRMQYNRSLRKAGVLLRTGRTVPSLHRCTHLLHGRQAAGD